MSLQAGGYDDQPGRSQRSRQPAKLNPIDHLPDPPSYSEALKINGARELPQSLPVYGRLWQKSRQWSREAGNHDPQFEPKVPTSEDIIEPNSASASFTSGRPLPPIAKSDSIDGLSVSNYYLINKHDISFKVTSFQFCFSKVTELCTRKNVLFHEN